MNGVTCLFLSVTESDPPRSWRSGMGKVVTLIYWTQHRRGGQLEISKIARGAKGSQIKRGALYTPANAQTSTRRVLSGKKSATILKGWPDKAK
ncbi:hypothetical protein SJI00_04900 [Pseudomonas sp. RP23018S]|uniref:hypothetical protein n=1 Tax=Pseudomonas sp. RP23018S TaxID=3096037 RepID=UPI002ACAD736|nr:hypothetical protein [Pseudomonas sp. RP23018S]MDZ5602119.1 hypothetical protein [Pseudomonas sp. RP23018S]